MSSLPLLVLALAAAGGVVLWVTRGGSPRLPGRPWAVHGHGLVAAVGLVLLFYGRELPTQAFVAGTVLACTALGGLAIAFLQRTGRRPLANVVVWGHAAGALLGIGLLLLASR